MQFRFERDQETVDVSVGDLSAKVRLHRADLPVYEGPLPTSDWNKTVIGPPARPFAELQVVDLLDSSGWTAAWVYRANKFMSTWEPRVLATLPPAALDLHDRIRDAGDLKAGCWDVLAWRDGDVLFAELKQGGTSDRIRESQLRWRQVAISLGVPADSFVIVEWYAGSV